MARYLTTRKRNNKKYKKSPKGRGKGLRSIRRCKTRKPKGFRKAKRHTVGKRRRMVGGADFDFNVNADDLQVFMSKIEKYTSPFSINGIKYKYYNTSGETVRGCSGLEVKDKGRNTIFKQEQEIFGFENVELVAKGFALVTKTGTIFSETNRNEQINVFACYSNLHRTGKEPICYAIVRCAKSSCNDGSEPKIRLKPNSNMDSRILFLFIDTRANSNVTKLGIKKVSSNDYNAFKFTTRLSSDDDTYRILVPVNEEKPLNLNDFFEAVASDPRRDFNVTLDSMHVNKPRIIRECLDPEGSSVGIPLFM